MLTCLVASFALAAGRARASEDAFGAGDGHHGNFNVTVSDTVVNHAASVIALAESACGYACVCALPEGASGFTTIELKANFLGTAKEGETVVTRASLHHAGRTTQVWDAEVVNETTGKTMALFRCTQMVLWPKT